MSDLSLEKMKEIRKSKQYTYGQIAELTNISKSSIEKIFSGANENPTLNYIKRIALALDCEIDDFIEYNSEPGSPYYADRKTNEMAQIIYENPDLRMLFQLIKDLPNNDIKLLITLINRLKQKSQE